MANELEHADLTGRLVLATSDHDPSKKWLKVEVPQALVHGLFATLTEPGLSKPPGTAHISVMSSDEIDKIGANKITENGQPIRFRLDSVKHVRPAGWDGVSRVWFAVVKSPELKKLRASYGLTPLVKGNHEFHVTVAIRKTGVLAPNSSITKHAFVGRDMLMPAIGGLAGAALGNAMSRKRKGNWLQEHIGALLGGIGGIGAGYGMNRLLPHTPATDNTSKRVSENPAQPVNPNENLTERDIATGTGTGIPAYMRQSPTGAEQRQSDRYMQAVGDPKIVEHTPAASGPTLADRIEPYLSSPSAIASAIPVTHGFSAALGAATQPWGSGLAARGAGALTGMGNAAKYDLNMLGAGAAYKGTDALQKNLGIDPSTTETGMNLSGARIGYRAASPLSNRLVTGAADAAAKYFPKIKAIGNIAAPVAKVTAMDAFYPATVAYDTAKSTAGSMTDAGKGAYDKYVGQMDADNAKYGPLEAMGRRIGRGVLQPGTTTSAVGYDIANSGGEKAVAPIVNATMKWNKQLAGNRKPGTVTATPAYSLEGM